MFPTINGPPKRDVFRERIHFMEMTDLVRNLMDDRILVIDDLPQQLLQPRDHEREAEA